MKPTASLCARIRFSTKDVGKGFYRGNRTGSTGAHTPYGGYLIDWRKVRNYNVPDLKNFKLTPYVTREIGEIETKEDQYDWEKDDEPEAATIISAKDLTVGRRTRAMAFLNQWRDLNRSQFDDWIERQEEEVQKLLDRERNGETVELFQRYRAAVRQKRLLEHNAEDILTVR